MSGVLRILREVAGAQIVTPTVEGIAVSVIDDDSIGDAKNQAVEE